MPSTAPELETATTLSLASLPAALAGYLIREASGSSEPRAELLAAHPTLAADLSAYFEVHDRLRLVAASTPVSEMHQAVTLTGTVSSTERILATAQTLDGHTGGATTAAPSTTAGVKTFGDYELIALIAKGGMGAVYKARQRQLNRIVAVKMILAGQFADQQDIDRFYAEAEAAANLRHPNIVAIHEVGVFEGQHFFSMDYIPGKSLSELVRENPLPAKQAAEYVRTIARAMHFAHTLGILHRDLKPSNVLLDKSGEPLITDFGLAKRVTDQSQLTATGAVLGTPSYMPPEQAAAEADKVGPASDVYSIGAILYELLTGRPPFIAATVMLTIRQVLESDPVSPRLLNSSVPRDLETICIKCLQKEPASRYVSAQDLVDELTRFLSGEPIRARPIGPVARAARWCKRNPLVASLGALAACGFLFALAASTVGYVRTSAALADSEESFSQARSAVDELFTEVSEDTLLNQPGMQPLREKLLRRALAYYERFLKQRGSDPKLRGELARALFRVGFITETIGQPDEARRHYEQAASMQREIVALHPAEKRPLDHLGDTASALGSLCFKLRDQTAALAAFREAIDVREKLVSLDASDHESQRLLANSYMNLGLFQRDRSDLPAARREYVKAQQIRQQVLKETANLPKMRRDLAKGHYNLATLDLAEEETESARADLERAIAEFERLSRDEPADLDVPRRLAVCYRVLADLQASLGQTDVALQLYEKAHARLEPLVRKNPDVLDFQTELAGICLNQGDLHRELNEMPAALTNFERARELLAKLVAEQPLVPQYRRDLAVTLSVLGSVKLAGGDVPAARTSLTESLGHLDGLLADRPNDEDLLHQRAEVVSTLKELNTPTVPNQE